MKTPFDAQLLDELRAEAEALADMLANEPNAPEAPRWEADRRAVVAEIERMRNEDFSCM